QPPIEEIAATLDQRALIRGGGMDGERFAAFLDAYLERTTRLHHPGSLAHQVASPDVPAALADLIHGTINNPGAIYEMGAAGATTEVIAIEWMLEKAGWSPAESAGVLTHGGSLANLTALLAARARSAPDAWEQGTPSDLAVLAPPSVHYSVRRAVAILGLGEQALIELEVDELERIRVDRLPDALERARAAGRRPMALVAASCATATGLHDDLTGIADFCEEHGIWLHVDAAHGASALLSPAHRHLLEGVERADSLIWDAHKMLRTSSLVAAVLMRHGDDLAGAFHQKASYLFYGDEHTGGIDLIERSVECTKAGLGLKLFLNLAWRGEQGLGAYVADCYDKALRFHELIERRPGFECPYVPESNILCFRFGHDADRQVAIRERLIEEGRFHLSSAEIGGERFLRIVVTAPATDDAAIELLLAAVEEADRVLD
ncbi:MAG TPA: aminotransferase class I/II-fold pyridoxal phosphate-dependent enzyme, partial [Thermoleophilaceae bacterium]